MSKSIVFQNWSIHAESGHCRHSSGVDVFFDPHITYSGGIRTIGPYYPLQSPPTARHLIELCSAIETRVYPGSYLVWGEICDEKNDLDPISILNESIYWEADLARRSQYLVSVDSHMQALWVEWMLEEHSVVHKSGVEFYFSSQGQVIRIELGLDSQLYGSDTTKQQSDLVLIAKYLWANYGAWNTTMQVAG